ncbi:hypothetical protein CBW65_17895 [Tumebacillus avium]|uniref:SbsC C-terminal domain-containing protein n=1 Tax=Tumebacillus avium TaxID=1903704 RepID=A0A1Y0ITE7_9BACL|nr:TolC family protein [Tumebacillus avium]ARU62634.1 hypothetical protein CBW65_17895 [Tumebacillus avium]
MVHILIFHKKTAAISLLTALMLTGQATLPILPQQAVVHAATILSLKDLTTRAAQVSPDLKDLTSNLQKKKYELTQAYQAVNIQAEKDASKQAKEHSLSRDIDLGTKIPTAQLEVKKAEREIENKRRALGLEIEQLYITAYQAQLGVQKAQTAQKKAETKVNDLIKKAVYGYAKLEDVEAAKAELETAVSAVTVAQLGFKTSRNELGQKVSMDLDGDFTFTVPRQYAMLNQKTLWQLIDRAEKTDLELWKDTEARRMAEAKVNLVRQLYRNKFGATAMQILESTYSGTQETDYSAFMTKYNELAANIDAKWKGKTWILVFSLPFLKYVPKKELQGEYEGMRYFEDMQNALPVAMLDYDKARLKESDTRQKLTAKIKTSYLGVKQAESTYILAMKALDKAKQDTKKAEEKKKFGVIKQEELDAVKALEVQASEVVTATFLAYKLSLSKLDLDTSGGVVYRNGNLPYQVDSGLDPLIKPPAPDLQLGGWKLEPVAEGMTSKFTLVDLKDGYKPTHFTLHSKKTSKQVGARTAITGELLHLNLAFSDTSDLYVVFYSGDKKLDEADLDGYAPKGTLTKK